MHRIWFVHRQQQCRFSSWAPLCRVRSDYGRQSHHFSSRSLYGTRLETNMIIDFVYCSWRNDEFVERWTLYVVCVFHCRQVGGSLHLFYQGKIDDVVDNDNDGRGGKLVYRHFFLIMHGTNCTRPTSTCFPFDRNYRQIIQNYKLDYYRLIRAYHLDRRIICIWCQTMTSTANEIAFSLRLESCWRGNSIAPSSAFAKRTTTVIA